MSAAIPKPRWSRMLLSRPDRVGDVVLSSSCLPAVSAEVAARGGRLHLYLDARMAPLFHRHPRIAGLVHPPHGGWLERAWRLRARLIELGVDAVVHLQPDPSLALGAALARVPLRVGWRRWRAGPSWTTAGLRDRRKRGAAHEVEHAFRLLALAGVSPPAHYAPDLHPDAVSHAKLVLLLAGGPAPRQLVVVHPAAHGAKARVPAELLARMAQAVCAGRSWRVALVGTEREEGLERLFELPQGPAVDLRGRTNLAELAWLLRDAPICIGRDSGPTQLAAAMGCPTLALFPDGRPAHGPARWRPLGPKVECVLAPTRGRWEGADWGPALARLLGPAVEPRLANEPAAH